MHSKAQRIRLLALLLGVVFLGAQFHFCSDLTANPLAPHVCPVCSVAGFAVVTPSPNVVMVPVTHRLEIAPLAVPVLSEVPSTISPRAPPAQ